MGFMWTFFKQSTIISSFRLVFDNFKYKYFISHFKDDTEVNLRNKKYRCSCDDQKNPSSNGYENVLECDLCNRCFEKR